LRGSDRDREQRERSERPGRSQRGERRQREPHGDRPDRDPALRAKYMKGRGEGAPRGEGAVPDPNSPFAKLAELKAQLEANAKEPR
jgi:ATP-dependent RNA helicase SUPV3L1/SUV3